VTSNKGFNQPVIVSKYKHLKRIFQDMSLPQTNNLILLLDQEDLRNADISDKQFEDWLGERTEDFCGIDKKSGEFLVKKIDLPVVIPPGRIQEVCKRKD
jgi:hypothetical protein